MYHSQGILAQLKKSHDSQERHIVGHHIRERQSVPFLYYWISILTGLATIQMSTTKTIFDIWQLLSWVYNPNIQQETRIRSAGNILNITANDWRKTSQIS